MTATQPSARTRLEKELAAPYAVSLGQPEHCDRCGVVLTVHVRAFDGIGAPERPCDAFWCVDWCDPGEPGQFWTRRGFYICRVCRDDIGYAAERVAHDQGVASGALPSWAVATGRRKVRRA